MLRTFILLLAGGALWAQARTHVAILPFSSDAGIDTAQRSAIVQRFQGELVQKQVYEVLERSQMELILQEQGFQASGACAGTDCQVQMGRLLAVDKLITGSLVRFDDLYVLSTSLLDVRTGAVERSWFTKVRGSIADVLEEGAPLAARQVIAGELKVPFAVDTLITGASRLRQERQAQDAARSSLQAESQRKNTSLVKKSLQSIAIVAVAAGLGGGIYHNQRMDAYYERYTAFAGTSTETQQQMDDSWSSLESHQDRRNRFYGLAGFGAAMFLGTTFFF